jgi:tRNA-Thr(GGU) m(6)t(6)A37 methyltransferase TsaA
MLKNFNNTVFDLLHHDSSRGRKDTPKYIHYKPIGIIHSPYKSSEECPRQPSQSDNIIGVAEIFLEYEEGLKGIENYSHIVIVSHLHLVNHYDLKIKSEEKELTNRGIFTTRSSIRPNSIGISIVRLIKNEKNKLHFHDVDLIDGTPILDIKPSQRRLGYEFCSS